MKTKVCADITDNVLQKLVGKSDDGWIQMQLTQNHVMSMLTKKTFAIGKLCVFRQHLSELTNHSWCSVVAKCYGEHSVIG